MSNIPLGIIAGVVGACFAGISILLFRVTHKWCVTQAKSLFSSIGVAILAIIAWLEIAIVAGCAINAILMMIARS